MVKDDIQQLIADFLTGELSPEDQSTLESWVKESPENKKEFLYRKELWAAAVDRESSEKYDSAKACQDFKRRAGLQDSSRRTSRRQICFRWAAVAAGVVLVALGGFFAGNKNVTSRLSDADIDIVVPLGSRTMMTLPDSTTVWLNAGSHLRYSQSFGVHDRIVSFSGEAYFEVKHQEDKPFIVRSEDLELTDLGTKFNICNYDNDAQATVSLLEGKVSLANQIDKSLPVTLSPDSRAILDKKSGVMTVSGHETVYSKDWINGYIFFDEDELSDIVKKLSRVYNVDITIKDNSIAKQRFYGNFVKREQSLNEILDYLASTGKLKYSIEGAKIVIY